MKWGKSAALLLAMSVLIAGHSSPAAAADVDATVRPSSDHRAQAVDCMTSAILYEAGFEPREGQEAVAEVILNRLRNPAFPKTICGVVFQGSNRRTGCQFSFTCDGSLRKIMPAEVAARAREVATKAVDGELVAHTSGATYYHADYVMPYWAPTLVRVAAIGRHIFYRQPGGREFSQLARYDATGERNPGLTAASWSGPDQGGSAKRVAEHERFMPWGLVPRNAPVAQSAEKP
jgi:spore germination cell wall hydrolase CwlJ-like protein